MSESDLYQWLEKHLCKLNLTDAIDYDEGYTRLGFSKKEKAAHEQFRQIATKLGLKTRQDAIGNQWAIWEVDPEAPLIGMGSHLDTVYSGGGYDGVAGVLCSLAVISELKRKHFKPRKNIAVLCFISEESARFGVSTIGSKTMVGNMNKQQWEMIKDQTGTTLRQAIEDYGLKWDKIDEAYCDEDLFESFIELHIEQGSQLTHHKKDIGIVQGISTPVRLNVTAYGDANHTGTTMMDERKDALVAISPLITYVHREAKKMNKGVKHPLVATVSKLDVKPNAMNVIPGEVAVGIDIRSVDDELKRNFARKVSNYCGKLAEESQIDIKVDVLVDEDSIKLDEEIQSKFVNMCQELNIPYLRMNSGAGHDVMNMATRWPSGLLFVPSVDGLSHHPKEYTPTEKLAVGVHVLETYIKEQTE